MNGKGLDANELSSISKAGALTALEDVKDLAMVRDFLTRRATSSSPAEMRLLRWEDVANEWDDDEATEA